MTVCHTLPQFVPLTHTEDHMGTELQVYRTNQKLQLWAERVKACRESGMSVADWCAANNLSRYTYYDWQRKVFAAAKAESGQTQFVEVTDMAVNTEVVARIRKTGYDIEILSMDALIRLLKC